MTRARLDAEGEGKSGRRGEGLKDLLYYCKKVGGSGGLTEKTRVDPERVHRPGLGAGLVVYFHAESLHDWSSLGLGAWARQPPGGRGGQGKGEEVAGSEGWSEGSRSAS